MSKTISDNGSVSALPFFYRLVNVKPNHDLFDAAFYKNAIFPQDFQIKIQHFSQKYSKIP